MVYHTAAVAIFAPAFSFLATADPTSLQPPNGLFERSNDCHAIVGADVVTSPGNRIEDATIVIRDGVVEAIGTDATPPREARIWHAEDMIIYPGFIEPALMVETGDAPTGSGTHWNNRVRAQIDLADPQGLEPLAASTRTALRESGFSVAAVHPSQGVFRGNGMILPMSSDAGELRPYEGTIPMSMGFERGGWGGYPSSLMGSIALMRQTFLDARWHQDCLEAWRSDPGGIQRPVRRDALAALAPVIRGNQPILLEAGSLNNIARADHIAREFDLDLWVLGTGDEFQNLASVTALDSPLIVPLTFPDRPDLASMEAADRVSLRSMQAWEQAPTNLRRLCDADVDVYVTTTGLGRPSDLRKAMRTAIETGGLDEDQALAMLTTRPARLLGLEDQIGRLEPGMAAHLVLCDGEFFDKKTKIHEVWIAGERHEIETDPMIALAGRGTFTSGDQTLEGTIDTSQKSFTLQMSGDESDEESSPVKVKAKAVGVAGYRMWGVIDSTPWDRQGWARFGGRIDNDTFAGRGRFADGTPFTFSFVVSDESGETNDEDLRASTTINRENPEDEQDPVTGEWVLALEIPGADMTPEITLNITRDGEDLQGTVEMMQQEDPLDEVNFDARTGTLTLSRTRESDVMTMNLTVNGGALAGTASSRFGEFSISGRRGDVSTNDGEETENAASADGIPEELAFPLGAFGRLNPPKVENLRIEGATIWTSGPAGIIKDGCLITTDGRIGWVGPRDAAPPTPDHRVVNATGLHVTPGLIDCHSHTGINGGVNEGGEACTAEVRIGDVVDPEDINWYRQLSGGLTACNQLHGSANPIGGQNCVVKLKWGGQADDFLMKDAIGGIKFALGENVKRSRSRYPNTRMGVDAFMRDRFAAADAYRAEWAWWNELPDEAKSRMLPPRRDLEMEAVVEVLEGDRLVHCHSYRQDEILALLRTAEEWGFTIGTLQHILEGYKLADAIADHGAGASSFSDWWAYKVEVMDAIPYNGSIMRDVGVNVSFNSDDNELATRMNDEAAKAVRYGGVPRAEALHFVTINPAWQLRIHERTGSLEVGKDADYVLWSADPLSSYSRCLETWIEGARYYDEQEDAEMRSAVGEERRRLTAKILASAIGAPATAQPDGTDTADPTTAESRSADGTPRRRPPPPKPTEEYEFPYEDQDHRGVCGCHEILE